MAAAAGNMAGVCEDSSSSEDETLRRCREAVWDTRADKDKDGGSPVKQSKRVIVAEHEHDGNELQVTQGFRTHVAKKLGLILDSCITETSPSAKSVKCDGDDDDDDGGFRLFSSSVPGQTAADPPAPVKRRPVPSSSDSDSEMETRLREAAVSVKDLLPSFPQASTPSPPPAELPSSEKTLAEGEERDVVKKKKKKKKKQKITQEESDSGGFPIDDASNGKHGRSEQENTQVKFKRKKKKKQEGNTEALD